MLQLVCVVPVQDSWALPSSTADRCEGGYGHVSGARSEVMCVSTRVMRGLVTVARPILLALSGSAYGVLFTLVSCGD